MANSTIEEIKERLNIVDVVSSYIPLKKAGTNYKANCPFHKEKSASLMVSASKQIWHCFGCGEGGDVFGFVMKYENLEFPETLKLLAEKAGVQLPKYTQQNVEQDQFKQRLIALNSLAARFYQKVFEQSPVASAARQYLKNRGLSAATIAEWQIGFAPDDYHILENFLLKRNYDPKDMLASGLVSKNERGQFDRFVNRITFPIQNYSGEVVGFTARILDPDAKAAKYVNSPETAIYSKGKIIFGLHQAKQAIRKEDCAIVAEGNMDVIACHQAGFKNVVGSSGTAFTYQQLQILSRLTKNLKFAFDADQAGLTATKRALELALQLGFNVYIVRIEGAKDPDELIKKNPKLFSQAVADAPLYLDYFFEKLFENYNPTSVAQKKQIVSELLPFIKKLSDPLIVNHYIRMLAQRLGSSERSLYELLAQQKPQSNSDFEKQAAGTSQNSDSQPLVKGRSYILEEKLLGYALYNSEMRAKILAGIKAEQIQTPKFRAIFETLDEKPDQNADSFIDALQKDQDVAKLALFMVESEYASLADQQAFEREFNQILKEFKANTAKIEMSAIQLEMVLAEQKKDKQKLEQLNKKFADLSRELKNY